MVQTIRDLIRICRAVEETEMRVRQFCPPPTNYRQLLEPDLAYRKPTGNLFPSVSVVSTDMPSSSQAIDFNLDQISAVSIQNPNTMSCWNCKGTGHRFRQCGQPRRFFCFKCGHDNVTVSKCPKCQKNVQTARQ